MKLKLHPHKPDEDIKTRAQQAIESLTKEFKAIEDPGVGPEAHARREQVRRKK